MVKFSERNTEICKRHQQGESYIRLAKAYNLSRERIRQIVEKENGEINWLKSERVREGHDYSFLDALQDARKELNAQKCLETRTYICLSRAGIIDELSKGNLSVLEYSDSELLYLRNFGTKCLELFRKACELWSSKNNAQ